MRSVLVSCLVLLLASEAAQAQVKSSDGSPHTVQSVPADNGISLEVLDWGGTGRAVVLLAALGDTAHSFDRFAPKLIEQGHIYGITRRGFGASSAPKPPHFAIKATSYSLVAERSDPKEPNPYEPDRLGDDVLAVIDALKLDRPVLIGQSIAGEELSSIGSRFPKKIAGLVYLDALSDYSYFDGPEDKLPYKAAHPWPIGNDRPSDIELAIVFSPKKYATLTVPILALVNYPRKMPDRMRDDPDEGKAFEKAEADLGVKLDHLQRQDKAAHIVHMPYASRDLLQSNEAEVLREVRTFLAQIK